MLACKIDRKINSLNGCLRDDCERYLASSPDEYSGRCCRPIRPLFFRIDFADTPN